MALARWRQPAGIRQRRLGACTAWAWEVAGSTSRLAASRCMWLMRMSVIGASARPNTPVRTRSTNLRCWTTAAFVPISPSNTTRTVNDQFDDRERAFENKYARDQEMQFKIVARRNRLLGKWAAQEDGADRGRGRSLCQGRDPRRFRGSRRRRRGPQGARRPDLGRRRHRRGRRSARRSSTRRSRRAASSSRRRADADGRRRDRER